MPRIFLALIAVAGVWLASVPSPAQNSAGSAIVLDIDGAIGPAAAEYIHDGLTEARRRQAAAVVLRMDTPGGSIERLEERRLAWTEFVAAHGVEARFADFSR